MTSKEKRKLSKIKFNAYRLRSKYQIPKKLYNLIISLDDNASMDYVKCLEELAEHYMRVSYYYMKYSSLEETISKDIDNILKDKGF